jgi:hypothetical protein
VFVFVNGVNGTDEGAICSSISIGTGSVSLIKFSLQLLVDDLVIAVIASIDVDIVADLVVGDAILHSPQGGFLDSPQDC